METLANKLTFPSSQEPEVRALEEGKGGTTKLQSFLDKVDSAQDSSR